MGAILKNEFLVNTLDSIKINDFYFFLMENMEFNSLKSFNESKIENCSELLCSYFMHQCLQGLHYMHSRLIAHRDIKLENILMNGEYKVKLADFSCFKKEKGNNDNKNKKSDKNEINKNNNISNNINHGNNIPFHKRLLSAQGSLKKDIFGLGIVMYRILFREHPFNYEYKMDRETYGDKLKNSKLNFKGKELTNDCMDFLKGILNHNVNKRFNINKALNHIWIIKTQKIINYIKAKNRDKDKFNLILDINNYVFKEDIEPMKNKNILLDYSTKDSEDKEKEKIFLRLKRKRVDINGYKI